MLRAGLITRRTRQATRQRASQKATVVSSAGRWGYFPTSDGEGRAAGIRYSHSLLISEFHKTSNNNGLRLTSVVNRKVRAAPLRGDATLDVSLLFTPRCVLHITQSILRMN